MTREQSKTDGKEALFEAIAMLQDSPEVASFLTDLCTPQELKAFAERWAIARLLDQGKKSYREISVQTGASTTTVTRVARFLNDEPNQGYQIILKKRTHNHHH